MSKIKSACDLTLFVVTYLLLYNLSWITLTIVNFWSDCQKALSLTMLWILKPFGLLFWHMHNNSVLVSLWFKQFNLDILPQTSSADLPSFRVNFAPHRFLRVRFESRTIVISSTDGWVCFCFAFYINFYWLPCFALKIYMAAVYRALLVSLTQLLLTFFLLFLYPKLPIHGLKWC